MWNILLICHVHCKANKIKRSIWRSKAIFMDKYIMSSINWIVMHRFRKSIDSTFFANIQWPWFQCVVSICVTCNTKFFWKIDSIAIYCPLWSQKWVDAKMFRIRSIHGIKTQKPFMYVSAKSWVCVCVLVYSLWQFAHDKKKSNRLRYDGDVGMLSLLPDVLIIFIHSLIHSLGDDIPTFTYPVCRTYTEHFSNTKRGIHSEIWMNFD